ncbi:ABC transporter permease [Streptomyces chromofuscus]|uniref:ABC transporter permease n=1 Tax=Streptomyces chromofuscus TaxID=42881 RepID=UPI0016776B2D|nr:ABC transporter permease [Streptomyces chromofuscus]GGT43336.1 hypothetical protein GCM10010254_73430 [Streptomyces chromofuscus]
MAGTLQRNSVASVGLRLFFVAGWRSHMALFRWMQPSAFIPTVIGVPTVQLLWFVHLGRYLDTHPVAYYAVGNALQSCAIVGLFAPAMSIQGERWSGTLNAVLATPANRVLMFVGRVVPAVLIGFLTSTVMLGLATLVADVRIALSAMPELALAMLVTASSCGAFGLVLGAIGLRSRDAILLANLTSYLMLLVCGVNIPLADLPGWLGHVGTAMPMTDGIQAARLILRDGGLPGTELLREMGKAAAFLIAAVLLLRFFERSSRRNANLDQA